MMGDFEPDVDLEDEDLVGLIPAQKAEQDWTTKILNDLRALVDTFKRQSETTTGVSQYVFKRALELLNALERRVESMERAGMTGRSLVDIAKGYVRTISERVE